MNQYLILHKVRGAPSFDIAEKAQFGDEEGWVLCTCGHRAYPWWYTELEKWDFMEDSGAEKAMKEMPPDWPEHYGTHPDPEKRADINMSAFFSSVSKFVRRI